MIARTTQDEDQVERGCAGRLRAEEGRDRRDAHPAPGAQRRSLRLQPRRGHLGPCRHASSTTPSCSSGSPTWPSTRASTPHSRPISRLRPARLQPPGLGLVGGRSVLSGDGDHPMTSTTDLSKKQLAHHPVGARRRAAQPRQQGRGPARDRPQRHSGLGLTTDDVLAAAPGLLDGRMSPRRLPGRAARPGRRTPVPATDAPQGAPDGAGGATPRRAGAAGADASPAQAARRAPAAAKRKAKAKAQGEAPSRPRLHRPTSPRPAPAPSRR